MYEHTSQMEPLLPSDRDGELEKGAIEIIRKSAEISGMLHPITRHSVKELLRSMNCYYSNLIEGHNTHPIDIERALKDEYSDDPAKRALQLESRAHIEVQIRLERRLRQDPNFNISDASFLCWIHKEFYERLPQEFRVIKGKGGLKDTVVPGELRKRDVRVGMHVPPRPDRIERFLERFAEVYEPKNQNHIQKLIMAAASHHRLLWIHPFLDGNGRVARLYTDAYLSRAKVDGHGLWAVARGLARHRDEYLAELTRGDGFRQNDWDGRGNLSDSGLTSFCRFFLDTSLDQVTFMTGLLELDGLLERINGYVEYQANVGSLRPEAKYLLREALLRGEVPRGEASRITGLSERTARKLLRELLDRGLLVAVSPKTPVRMGFPVHAIGYYFPRLYPEGVELSLS